jgi:hypothetical protein
MAWWYVFPLESLTVNTSPDRPTRIQTPIQFPAVLALTNASDEVVVEPASLLVCCTSVTPAWPALGNKSSTKNKKKEDRRVLASLYVFRRINKPPEVLQLEPKKSAQFPG